MEIMDKRLYIAILLYIIGSLALIVAVLSKIFQNYDLFSISEKKIVILKLYGTITYSSESVFSNTIPAEKVVEILKNIDNDSSVVAVILDINSRGGTVVGCYVIEEAIRKMKKPVIAVCDEECTSGAYLIASAAKKIFMSKDTLTGSIGVILSYLDFSGLLKRFNITYVVIKSGKYKDIGSPYRPLTEKEYKILKEIVDNAYKNIVRIIERNRNINMSELPEYIREAGIITGEEAVKYGLADDIGTLSDVIDYVNEKYCNNECRIETIDLRELSSLF